MSHADQREGKVLTDSVLPDFYDSLSPWEAPLRNVSEDNIVDSGHDTAEIKVPVS